MYRSNCISTGVKAENRFKKIAETQGYTVNNSTYDQNVFHHVDLVITNSNNFTYRIEVKAMKKVNRSDSVASSVYTWLEIRGVRDDGWIYNTDADFIAFETINGFILIKPMMLERYIMHNVDETAHVHRPEDALYKVYRRPNRNDMITLAKIDELRDYAEYIWE